MSAQVAADLRAAADRAEAERRQSQTRTVVWAPDRYVPIGVIEGAA